MTEAERDYFRERKKAWRSDHALRGLCSECTTPALPDRSHCAAHGARAARKAAAKRRDRPAAVATPSPPLEPVPPALGRSR